jgi:dipeptidyl aminopeptidase/acylaminoacyl peptidase
MRKIPFIPLTTIIFVLLAALLLAGCVSSAGTLVETRTKMTPGTMFPTDTPNVTNTSSITPSLTPKFTDTPLTTKIPIPTSTIPVEARLEYRCLQVNPNPPDTGSVSGMVGLLGNKSIDGWWPYYLLDMTTGSIRPLVEEPDLYPTVWGVSPDHKWLAYTVENRSILIVNTFEKEQESIKIPLKEKMVSLGEWLNNKNLLIYMNDGSKMSLNPFSGEWKSLFKDFPDYAEPIGVGADWWPAQYSPSLNEAIYLRTPVGNGRNNVLWNLKTNETVADFKNDYGPFGVKPVWSPSGDKLIMSLYQVDEDENPYTELFRISEDGNILKITNLRAYYTESLSIREYQWLPDESLVAFWLRYTRGGQSKDQLAILDMETYHVTNYCIDDRWGTSRELVWSPEGRQLIVNGVIDEKPAVLMLDLDNQIAFSIAGDFRVRGWLVSSP